jgi:hypothetical protein
VPEINWLNFEFLVAVDLGSTTILGCGCMANYLPLLWTSLAAWIHLVATIRYRVDRRRLNEERQDDHIVLP